jgi:hypothetical protein
LSRYKRLVTNRLPVKDRNKYRMLESGVLKSNCVPEVDKVTRDWTKLPNELRNLCYSEILLE